MKVLPFYRNLIVMGKASYLNSQAGYDDLASPHKRSCSAACMFTVLILVFECAIAGILEPNKRLLFSSVKNGRNS